MSDKKSKPSRFEALKKANEQGPPTIVIEQPANPPQPLRQSKAATRGPQTKQVSGHYLIDDYRTLKTIGVEQDKTIQEMLGEALQMYAAANGKTWVGSMVEEKATA